MDHVFIIRKCICHIKSPHNTSYFLGAIKLTWWTSMQIFFFQGQSWCLLWMRLDHLHFKKNESAPHLVTNEIKSFGRSQVLTRSSLCRISFKKDHTACTPPRLLPKLPILGICMLQYSMWKICRSGYICAPPLCVQLWSGHSNRFWITSMCVRPKPQTI